MIGSYLCNPKPGEEPAKGEKKAGKENDYAAEMEAMKQPIFSHMMKLLTTMYDTKTEYKMEGGKPDFCGDHECPKYEVLCKNEFYEVRKYPPAKWVETDICKKDHKEIEMGGNPIEKAFHRLYGYISGKNDKKEKIEMTVPVLVHVKNMKEVDHDKKEMEMKFYLAKDAPKPENPDVKIVESKEVVFYVKMFGGWVLDSLWKPKTHKFHKILTSFNQKVDEEFGVLGATYDKPSKFLNRHNEILMKAADQKENAKYCKME
ncbi:unnamed protein product [Gordionus sp. m RMFG-2023]